MLFLCSLFLDYFLRFWNFFLFPPTMDANVKMHHVRDTGESPPTKSVRTCMKPGGEEHQSVQPFVVHDLRAVNFETCSAMRMSRRFCGALLGDLQLLTTSATSTPCH